MAKARKRIASVFTYLQELHRVRTPPIVEIDRYPWRLRLADIPTGDTIEWGSRLAAVGRRPGWRGSDEFLLRVGRPAEVPCPEPPQLIRERLATGWELPAAPARMRTSPPTVVADDSDAFLQSSARQDAFERWVARREEWVRQQEPLALFLRLYDLYTQFERESEKYQLYFGDGMLECETREGEVCHPLLLQRLELRFDPAIPAFTVTESDESPILYSPMLRHLAADGKLLLQLQQDFAREGCDPLAGEGTERFLKTLVHALWPGGALLADREAAPAAKGPRVYRDPMLYLGRRSQDFAGAIDRYLEAIPDEKELPRALLRVVGIDTDEERTTSGAIPVVRAPDETESELDLLLTRPANQEQRRVIRRLEETGAVIVQGPPGTGKSHTIANLIGHLLAQNKSILVTSHASKALRVVREQVARPLQSLCVSVLDSDEESAKQLEDSINGILNYFSLTTKYDLEREIGELGERRAQLSQRCAELTAQLRGAVAGEYGTLEVDGERIATAEVVAELAGARGKHDWLPGPVSGALPLEDDEVAELYRLAGQITADDEGGGRLILPDLTRLPDPDAFAELCNARTRAATTEAVGTNPLWKHASQRAAELDDLIALVGNAAAIFTDQRPWMLECMSDSQRSLDAEEPWRELCDLIQDASARIPPRQSVVLQRGPEVSTDLPLSEGIEVCQQIIQHLSTGKKLGAMAAMFKPQWQAFIRGCRVDGGAPDSAAQFQAILALLEIAAIRAALCRRWDRQMPQLGAPPAQALGPEPEKAALPYAAAITRALGWVADHVRTCERRLTMAGLDWMAAVRQVPVPPSPHGPILQLRALFTERLPALLVARRHFITAERLAQNRDTWLTALAAAAEQEGDQELVRALTDAILNKARAGYATAWQRARRLADIGPVIARRDELISRIEDRAPAWAAALRSQGGALPGAGDPSAAWTYRLWAQALSASTATDVDALQVEVNRASAELQHVTAEYVEKMAWKAQFERTGLEEQQALAGWLALHKKIGKGSGKNAARLKEEAKRTLVKCRQAVPVWIMPMSRVVDSFDIATTRFDVVILDEASQCDVVGLACFAMAKQVAVVGDHEQVSPYAVGHRIDKIQGLIDELLDEIPNKQLYDGKTSVYDLARQSFGGAIRLLEHFRCVPEIIGFSNLLAYAGEIRPLREASSARVKPALLVHPVTGGEKVDKVNEEEANEIAALVTAVCEMPEYDDCTIGVISMVGTEQAVFIDALLRQHLPVAEYRRRRLLCGNASQFQGDERDIIFISMVDSPAAGKRLPILRRDEAKKVFNVAASRARDQLWIVHSLEPARDLKPDDLRLKLIAHGLAPAGKAGVELADGTRTPTAIERALVQALRARDYRALLHVPIGDHVIDIVVEGRGGDRVGIQCDGGRQQSPDQLAAAVERQLTLERLGWRFIRVRASAFSLAPEESVDRVCARLRELDIAPGASEPVRPDPGAGDLSARVQARARELRRGARTGLRAISSADAG